MSQKSVTEGFDSIEKDLDKTKKRVINLEKGISPDPFYTDDSVSYVKNVPSNALPYAEIEKVGGITRKSKNLLPVPYFDGFSKDTVGTNWVVNEDGSVTVTGTATENATFCYAKSFNFEHGKTYGIAKDIIVAYRDASNSTNYVATSIVWDESYTLLQIYSQVRSGDTVSKTIYPMINDGTKQLPYEQYFEGLRSAKVTEIVSSIENLNDTLLIPEAVQELDGYGESNPDNTEEYNYIDWDRLVFVAKGHIVDGLWISFDVVKETDISYYLTNDNFIKVEGSGVITMLNEYQFDVPSEITYMLKG
jgi:hypothetical protein